MINLYTARACVLLVIHEGLGPQTQHQHKRTETPINDIGSRIQITVKFGVELNDGAVMVCQEMILTDCSNAPAIDVSFVYRKPKSCV